MTVIVSYVGARAPGRKISLDFLVFQRSRRTRANIGHDNCNATRGTFPLWYYAPTLRLPIWGISNLWCSFRRHCSDSDVSTLQDGLRGGSARAARGHSPRGCPLGVGHRCSRQAPTVLAPPCHWHMVLCFWEGLAPNIAGLKYLL